MFWNTGARSSFGSLPIAALGVVALTTLVPARMARACDVCAIYTATEQREARAGLRLGIAEQYSFFGTERLGGDEVTLPAREWMESSVTQLLLGYTFTPRLSLQLSLPLIVREFRRIRNHQIERGSENGVGDLALVGNFLAYSRVSEASVFRFSVLAGLKFPTGDPSRLGEEAQPAALTAATTRARSAQRRLQSGATAVSANVLLPEEGGLHGHDLALGSGSYDGIVGGQWFWSLNRFFATAVLQYAIRGTGAFDYRFANDLTLVGGPGMFVLLTHDYSLGLQAVLSGETKGNDVQAGRKANDTAMTALYVGPGASFTWGTSLGAELGIEVPVYQHNTSLQLVPDWRIRGGFNWRF
jgi:hypothetical protein